MKKERSKRNAGLNFLKTNTLHIGVTTAEESAPKKKSRRESDGVVDAPPYYTPNAAIECIDAIRVATEGLLGFEAFCTGTAMKYLWRWKRKNGKEDLKKAQWYISKLIGE